MRQPNRPHDLRFPYSNRSLIIGWRTLFFKEGEYKPDPTKSADWNRGAYLVEGLGHCGMCHTAINALGGSSESAGVRGRPDPDAELVRAVADLEQGSRARRVEHQGNLRPAAPGVSDRGAVYGPMAEVVYNSLQYLNDDDTRAMAVYLKSLTQGTSPEKPAPALPSAESQPAALARQDHLRQAVRQLPRRDPASACRRIIRRSPTTSPSRWSPPSIAIRMVLNGGYPPGTAGNPMPYGMPPFAQALSDDEVAAVVTYIRTSWGNRGTPVSARQANELRAATLN